MLLRLAHFVETATHPALIRLPRFMDTPDARVMLLAIGLQESGFTTRRQLDGGPGRGFWQFELGTRESHGGVWGVWLHSGVAEELRLMCKARGCEYTPTAIYETLEQDDVLAAGVARLLLFTDHRSLPNMGDAAGSWDCYMRNWRPGKPRRAVWAKHYRDAMNEVVRPRTDKPRLIT